MKKKNKKRTFSYPRCQLFCPIYTLITSILDKRAVKKLIIKKILWQTVKNELPKPQTKNQSTWRLISLTRRQFQWLQILCYWIHPVEQVFQATKRIVKLLGRGTLLLTVTNFLATGPILFKISTSLAKIILMMQTSPKKATQSLCRLTVLYHQLIRKKILKHLWNLKVLTMKAERHCRHRKKNMCSKTKLQRSYKMLVLILQLLP